MKIACNFRKKGAGSILHENKWKMSSIRPLISIYLMTTSQNFALSLSVKFHPKKSQNFRQSNAIFRKEIFSFEGIPQTRVKVS